MDVWLLPCLSYLDHKRLIDVHRNIWAPNRQVAVTEVIGNYYKFSPRLLGMMCTTPPKATTTQEARPEKMRDRLMNKFMRTDDVERGIRTSLTNARAPTIPTSPASSTQYSEKTEIAENPSDPSHYMIAGQMINYSSTDITNRCTKSSIILRVICS